MRNILLGVYGSSRTILGPTYIVVGVEVTSGSQSVHGYLFDNGFGTKVANPSTGPGIRADGVDFNNTNTFVAVGTTTLPFIHAYNWNGAFGTKVSSPAVLPASSQFGVKFSRDSTHIVSVGQGNANVSYSAYIWNNGFGSKLASAATHPAPPNRSVVFSNNNDYVAIAHSASPCVTVYPWNNGFGTKISDPTQLPSPSGEDVEFSPSDSHICISHTGTFQTSVYPWSGGFGTKVANPVTQINGLGGATACKFTSSGNRIAYGLNSNSPGTDIAVYEWSGSFGTRINSPPNDPLGAYDVDFSKSDDYIFTTSLVSTAIEGWAWNGSFGTKLANPSTAISNYNFPVDRGMAITK